MNLGHSHRILPFVVILCAITLLMTRSYAHNEFDFIQIADTKNKRILYDNNINGYWVASWPHGLILLTEDQPGQWSYQRYILDWVYDICGPDSNGYLYCTHWRLPEDSGIYVFNTITRTVVYDIDPFPGHKLTGLTLNQDETRLYVLGRTSSQSWGSWMEPDTGIVFEIDITSPTYDILDQGITSALPSTIYYSESNTGPDKLVIYCIQMNHYTEYRRVPECRTDIIEVSPGLPRVAQLRTSFQGSKPFYNDMIKWSDDPPLVALLNMQAWFAYHEYPDVYSSILILNTDTHEIVNRINLYGDTGGLQGASHGVISNVYPGWVYFTIGSSGGEVNIIDYNTGSFIKRIPFPTDIKPDFLCETPDGRLIVTGFKDDRIFIVDPS